MKVRVYAVEKTKGWDVLSHRDMQAGNIPKTVTHVHIAWGDGKDKTMTITRADFLAKFQHSNGINWTTEVETPQQAPADSEQIKALRKRLVKAEASALKAMESRRALDIGATRARVTTANARWMSACEERDLIAEKLRELGA